MHSQTPLKPLDKGEQALNKDCFYLLHRWKVQNANFEMLDYLEDFTTNVQLHTYFLSLRNFDQEDNYLKIRSIGMLKNENLGQVEK